MAANQRRGGDERGSCAAHPVNEFETGNDEDEDEDEDDESPRKKFRPLMQFVVVIQEDETNMATVTTAFKQTTFF